ncbi:hypothetical protein [Microbispora amethystogenes]|uniref:Uncharacterized protein n=1 Tax=Microbispora amethystogenes TaxID=1427754 RepID=A0ABQ4FIQ9_9ACTN|nr:hypothetical protein [Microbispora amethystogenes]GIH34707.1 hypothetical protein Mam01_48710 [Microbispora amethystogenes]
MAGERKAQRELAKREREQARQREKARRALANDKKGLGDRTNEHIRYRNQVDNTRRDDRRKAEERDSSFANCLLNGCPEYADHDHPTSAIGDTAHIFTGIAGIEYGLPVPGGRRLFPNQMPSSLQAELGAANSLGVKPVSPGSTGFDAAVGSGTVKWAVLDDGTLVVVPKHVRGTEVSHSVLSRGAPVRAAGEAEIAGNAASGYFGLEVSNHSGHFRPSPESLEVGKQAFGKAGIHFVELM